MTILHPRARELQLVCYGCLADQIGRSRTVLVPERVGDVAGLKFYLATLFPEAEAVLTNGATRVAIGDGIAREHDSIAGAAQVELLPPVSGG